MARVLRDRGQATAKLAQPHLWVQALQGRGGRVRHVHPIEGGAAFILSF
jgi:hypothetical protein